jgi:hypothetical protein
MDLGTSRASIYEVIDTKLNYTHTTFFKREGKGETFLSANFDFLTFNLFFVVAVFLLLKIASRVLQKYKIGKVLRPFSSFVLLAPLVLDGNLQYFFFLLFTQISCGFSLNWQDKLQMVAGYLFYFLVLWLSIASNFLAFRLHKKLAKYALDPWRTRIVGLLSYYRANVLRMLIFGALHSLLRNHPAQLPLLMLAEAFFVVFLVFSMRCWRAHRAAFKIWLAVSFALLRIALQITLIIQQFMNAGRMEIIEKELFDNINGFLLTIYLSSFYFATIWEVVYEVIDVLKSKTKKKRKQQREKVILKKAILSKEKSKQVGMNK